MAAQDKAPLKLVVAGAGGRMGQTLIRYLAASPDADLLAAVDQPGAACIGNEQHGVTITDDICSATEGADGLIDFTAPEASLLHAQGCASRKMIHVIGTTGFTEDQEQALREAGRGARIVKAGNFSIGVNLLMALTKQAATSLGPEFDIEITETHHRHKVDAPSGTALMLGEAAAAGRKIDLAEYADRGRDGIVGPKKEGAIGFSSVRTGEVIGEHTVIFGGPTERIELRHIASDRSLFAEGALRAAIWAQDRAPGFYSMEDVLGV
jgi:4-hydroxy-tetrahydrodipicolinate reductase